jgi:hypothetical protein
MDTAQLDPYLDMRESSGTHGPYDVGNPITLNQRLLDGTTLSGVPWYERDQVRHYVLKRAPIKPLIFPKQGRSSVAEQHKGGRAKYTPSHPKEMHVELAPRFQGIITHLP